jgi:5-methylcytosine-specific restriction endonuclease McrA
MGIDFNSTRCCYCERKFDEKLLKTKEHVIPKSKGGDNSKYNLVWACVECNCFRGNKDFVEFKELITNILNNNRSIKIKNYTFNRIDLTKMLKNISNPPN